MIPFHPAERIMALLLADDPLILDFYNLDNISIKPEEYVSL